MYNLDGSVGIKRIEVDKIPCDVKEIPCADALRQNPTINIQRDFPGINPANLRCFDDDKGSFYISKKRDPFAGRCAGRQETPTGRDGGRDTRPQRF